MRDLDVYPAHAIKFLDGAPDVTDLPCDKITGAEIGDYMRRYHLVSGPAMAVRFHQILASDPGEYLHDHPWDFISVMLDGTYTEITPTETVRYEAPCVIRRTAEQLHRLVLTEGPAWTYVVCGRVRRRWGFATPQGWVRHDHLQEAGAILPCEPAMSTARAW